MEKTKELICTTHGHELRKELEQEQNHRNGDHMEGYQWKKVETK